MDWKHRLYAGGLGAIVATGAAHLLARWTRGKGVVLMFHRVRPEGAEAFSPNRALEITPDFLDASLRVLAREGYDVIPIGEVPGRLAKGGKPFAALTFDDGYRDNIQHAWPVMRRHGVPWTVYVTSAFASGNGRLWWIELEMAIARLSRVSLDSPAGDVTFLTRTLEEKQAAFERLRRMLLRLDEGAMLDAVGRLARAAGVDAGAVTREHCAGWDEIRTLARDPDVTIGSHTLTHPRLARHGLSHARHEIMACRQDVSERIGRPVEHFAYPYGDVTAAGPREFDLAAEAGYATAVTTRPGHLHRWDARRPTALARVSLNGHHQSETALLALLSGVPFVPMMLMGTGNGAGAEKAGRIAA